MALRGCISVDRLPLQVLLRENPGWKGTPVAVTKEERPQSPILALNREARERGLAVGMKYAAALSLEAVIPEDEDRVGQKDQIEDHDGRERNSNAEPVHPFAFSGHPVTHQWTLSDLRIRHGQFLLWDRTLAVTGGSRTVDRAGNARRQTALQASKP